jgi:hypothetical protein
MLRISFFFFLRGDFNSPAIVQATHYSSDRGATHGDLDNQSIKAILCNPFTERKTEGMKRNFRCFKGSLTTEALLSSETASPFRSAWCELHASVIQLLNIFSGFSFKVLVSTRGFDEYLARFEQKLV